MSIVKALSNLKNNLFGGAGNTGYTRPPASRTQDVNMQESPTGRLGENPLAFSSFSYPSDVTNDAQNGHYILFYVNVQNRTKYEYKSNQSGNYHIGGVGQKRIYSTKQIGPEKVEVSETVDTKGMSTGEKAYYFNRAKKKGLDTKSDYDHTFSHESNVRQRATLTGVGSKAKTTTRITDSVAIYLPPNVLDTTGATYNDMQTGMLGYAATAGLDFAKFQGSGDYERAAQVLTGGLSAFATEALKKAGAAFAETLTGTEGAAQLANRVFGQADNPYLEVLFDTMNLRSFTYNFIFAPRNEKETMEVQRIIQLFRFHMAPELQGGQSRFLTLPSEFDIHYMYQSIAGIASENDYYNRIGTCILENCETNYTPDGVKSFADGSPTKITMGLTFKETDMLTKDKIAAGY